MTWLDKVFIESLLSCDTHLEHCVLYLLSLNLDTLEELWNNRIVFPYKSNLTIHSLHVSLNRYIDHLNFSESDITYPIPGSGIRLWRVLFDTHHSGSMENPDWQWFMNFFDLMGWVMSLSERFTMFMLFWYCSWFEKPRVRSEEWPNCYCFCTPKNTIPDSNISKIKSCNDPPHVKNSAKTGLSFKKLVVTSSVFK